MPILPRNARSPVPKIARLPDDPGRPFWSVMLPVYNSTDHFEQSLRSVLDQDPGPDRMQIAVVDDHSPHPRHEEVVRRLAPSRVEVHRQPRNLGLCGNWNSCVERSRGHWVHILHQDDYVLPGFYERLALAGDRPDVGAAFCRHTIRYDGQDRPVLEMPRERPTAGVLEDWLRTICQDQHVHCPSIVVARRVYEQLGGFRPDLCYALDWEMWVRIAASYRVWYEPEFLAWYRLHTSNETMRLRRNGSDTHDVLKAIRIVAGYLPPGYREIAGREMRIVSRDHEVRCVTNAFKEKDLRGGLACLHRAYLCDPSPAFIRTAIRYYAKWAVKIGLGEVAALVPGLHRPRSLKTPAE
jgi:glycosyltransferase involved in cell wall biosynthesis